VPDRLFDISEVSIGALTPVLAFDPSRYTNGHRVMDLARLGYLPEPVLDPTYGPGGMWTQHRPDRLVGCDILSLAPDVQCSYLALPFRDQSFASCIFDPPYKLTGDRNTERGGNHGDLATRFQTKTTRRAWLDVDQALAECNRVTRLVLIVKCQDQVESSWYVMQTRQVVLVCEAMGWRIAGQLHMVNYVGQPEGRVQLNIRNNYSTFLGFKR
jgi:hypothetical protein